MTFVRFKNLNVGRSRPSNKFQTHSTGNENLGYNKEDTWLSILARTGPRKLVVRQWIPDVKSWLKDGPVLGSHEPIHVPRAATFDQSVTKGESK